jgi:hypothetical protein
LIVSTISVEADISYPNMALMGIVLGLAVAVAVFAASFALYLSIYDPLTLDVHPVFEVLGAGLPTVVVSATAFPCASETARLFVCSPSLKLPPLGRGYMSLIGLLTRRPPGATRDVRRIPGAYYSAPAGSQPASGETRNFE